MSCLRFNSLSFSRSMFESVAFESFGYDHIQSSWLRKVSVWISKYFGYFYFIHLICLFFFFKSFLNLLNFKFICNCTCANPDPCPASQWIISVMTKFDSALIQRISISISESLDYDRDCLFSHSADQYLNQQIFGLWLRLTLLQFSGSVFESVNPSVMIVICWWRFQQITDWISESFDD